MSIEGEGDTTWGPADDGGHPMRGARIGVDTNLVLEARRARVFGALFPEFSPVRFGRYVVRGEVGSGGMGVVLEAYDEELERSVAIKVLHEVFDERHTARMRREAQAMAKLSHPNVVQVFEVGENDGQTFIAMELIEGQTVQEWMRARPRHTWRACTELFLQLGAGLAAAHKCGLVHRDFKPSNAIVDEEGRARVLDFGLAGRRTIDDAEVLSSSVAARRAPTDEQHAVTPEHSLTKTGALLGTPAYMAPEQLRGHPVDARADQFSFCVALYEAVYGERPFPGTLEMRIAELGADLPEPEPSTNTPKWLYSLLRRGLEDDPRDRFESMEELLRELSRPRGRVWRGALYTAAVVLVSGVVAGALLSNDRVPPCDIDDAAVGDAWNSTRRAALRTALADVEPERDPAGSVVERSLDRWSESWLDSLRSSCEATRIEGIQSEGLLDLRNNCLERQRREAAAVIEFLTRPDGVVRASELLEELPDVAVCNDPRLEETMYPMPEDPRGRDETLAAFEQIGRSRMRALAGRSAEAEQIAAPLAERVSALEYLPLTLKLDALMAERSLWLGQFAIGLSSMRRVIRSAEVAGLDELSATLRTKLASKIVGHWGESALQEALLLEAEIAVERVGRSDDPRRWDLEMARTAWVADEGRSRAALARYENSIERARRRGDPARVGRALLQRGRLQVEVGQLDAAEESLLGARREFAEAYGPTSLDDVRVELDLGFLEIARGRLKDAGVRLERLRERYGALLLRGSDIADMLELAEAKIAFMHGDFAAAALSFARVAERSGDSVHRGEAWQGLGVILFYQKDFDGSLAAYDRARAVFLRVLGGRHATVGILVSNIGESLAAAGDHHGALEAFDEALEILRPTLPAEHLDLAFPYKGRALSRHALGHRMSARWDLERALQIHEGNPGEPVEHADVEFELAQLLVEDAELDRAYALAEAAQARLVELGQEDLAREIEDWVSGLAR